MASTRAVARYVVRLKWARLTADATAAVVAANAAGGNTDRIRGVTLRGKGGSEERKFMLQDGRVKCGWRLPCLQGDLRRMLQQHCTMLTLCDATTVIAPEAQVDKQQRKRACQPSEVPTRLCRGALSSESTCCTGYIYLDKNARLGTSAESGSGEDGTDDGSENWPARLTMCMSVAAQCSSWCSVQ